MRPRRKGGSNRISCTRCDKTFSKTEHLNRHQLAHTGERPYVCSICSKQFARRDVLLRHRRNHTIESKPKAPEPPIDPFEQQATHKPPLDPAFDDHLSHDLLIPVGISDPTFEAHDDFFMTTHPSRLDQNVSANGNIPDYHTQSVDRSGSNADVFGLLFEQSVGTIDPPATTPFLDSHSFENIVTGPVQLSPSAPTSRSDTAEGIASKIQRFWPATSRSDFTQAKSEFWQDIAFGSLENIFSSYDLHTELGATQAIGREGNTPEISLTESSRARLRGLKRKLLVCGCNDFFDDLRCGLEYICINNIEVFEQGFYLYCRRYQPTYPVLHPATFDSDKVSDLLLFVMSMIGVSFLKTDDAIDFIRELYPTILNEVHNQFISTTVNLIAPNQLLSYLVLAHHTLFLFISTGGNLCAEKSQSLYLHVTKTAQRFGFFCSSFDDTYDLLLSAHTEQQRNSSEWIAWSRAESTKNLIIGLVLHDSWLSGLFSMNPIISTDNLVLCLPMEGSLYNAPTPIEWSRLLNESPHPNQKFELSSHTFHLPDLQGPIPIHSMYGLLCSVLLRAFADTHRLVVCSDLLPVDQHLHIPWNICRLDKRASIIAPLLMQLMQLYDTNLRESNPNGVVIWHSIWMLLTVDINVLFRAAGHDGPQPMFDARKTLSSWACTPAARRASLHAVQSLRILSHRKPADGTAFQSVRTLFISALILGFYVLGSPDAVCKESPGPRSINFDLASSVVDWKIIGDEGISNPESPGVVPRDFTKLDDPAVRFIRFGGPILIDGKRYDSGARHAQRIFLEFASLLDEVGTHWMAGYARLLYMIHDTLATP